MLQAWAVEMTKNGWFIQIGIVEKQFYLKGQVRSQGLEDLLEEGMETHSRILAWRIPWTDEPDGLLSMGTMVHGVVRNQRQGN